MRGKTLRPCLQKKSKGGKEKWIPSYFVEGAKKKKTRRRGRKKRRKRKGGRWFSSGTIHWEGGRGESGWRYYGKERGGEGGMSATNLYSYTTNKGKRTPIRGERKRGRRT